MKRNAHSLNSAFLPIVMIFSFLLVFHSAVSPAAEVTLAWDANSEQNLAGYKLYYDGDTDSEMYQGTGANEGDSPVVIHLEDLTDSDSPAYTVTGLEGGQYYYFTLTAFDTDGLESDYSEEVGVMTETAEPTNLSDMSDISGTPGVSGTSATIAASEAAAGKSGGGGGCFISCATDNRTTGSSPTVAACIFLILCAAAMMRSGRSRRLTAIRSSRSPRGSSLRTSFLERTVPGGDRPPRLPFGRRKSG